MDAWELLAYLAALGVIIPIDIWIWKVKMKIVVKLIKEEFFANKGPNYQYTPNGEQWDYWRKP